MRLLIVEDETRIAELVCAALERAGFVVDAVATAAHARAYLTDFAFDVAILDLGLPDCDGIALLRDLRRARNLTPMLVLTARDAVEDRVAGLDAGADDYLVKPFAMAELVARAKALLRRPGHALGMTLEAGNVAFDTVGRDVRIGTAPVTLARQELAILEHLMRRLGRVVPKSVLEDKLYCSDREPCSNPIPVHVHHLRRKLAGAGATRDSHRARRGLPPGRTRVSWPRSLQGQLVLGLAAIFIAATSITMALVGYEGYTAARALSDESLAHEFLDEFISDAAWAIPVLALAVAAAVTWTVRRGLAPLRAASEMAARIAPASTALRLPEDRLPLEVAPLVEAVNGALDRLERGIVGQRQFTASAAHELRTPLAVLTAGLDSLGDGPEIAKLRADAARMNRLVDQLLRVARLDALPLDVSRTVDLQAIAVDTVAYLAPWAISQDRSLAFEGPERPVWVRGNADAIADALRNLIENAVAYAPPGTEATVALAADGALSVMDRGPGVPLEDRGRMFERFWRGSAARAVAGTGLGLAIVAEIARGHGALVEVTDAAGGGTEVTLRFPLAKPP